VSCASTGNLANSTAAIAAHAGLDCCVFIPSDLEAGKILGTLIYNPTLMAVKGNYDQVNRLCSEVANTFGWGFVNINLRPYYSEGSKTLGYEVFEQLGWQLPDHIVAPLASGSLFTKIAKGFQDFIQVGLVGEKPVRFSGAQAEGCAPIAEAFLEGRDFIKPVKPHTIATSIAIGNPADGPYAIDLAKRTGGSIAAVSDAEIVAGIKLLAETEGVFTETAGGTTIAVLKRLVEQGKINAEATTVAYITGNGLKTTEAVADAIGQPYTIEAQLDSFRSAWAQAQASHRSLAAGSQRFWNPFSLLFIPSHVRSGSDSHPSPEVHQRRSQLCLRRGQRRPPPPSSGGPLPGYFAATLRRERKAAPLSECVCEQWGHLLSRQPSHPPPER